MRQLLGKGGFSLNPSRKIDAQMKKILLIEDNQDLVQMLRIHLRERGYEVDAAADGETGLERALSGEYSLIILDISLPKRDGLEVLQEIRQSAQGLPVLMLTARSEEIDKVVGLDLGADDYVTKPFSVAELLSRINALLRRVGDTPSEKETSKGESLAFGELLIDLERRQVTLQDEEVDLTPMEFELLAFLASHAGQAFTRSEILENVWEYEGGDYESSVTNMIMRIRKKIEKDPISPEFIRTVRGFGYRFVTPEEIK